jgi:DNA-directed RNA polymerase specialized sigma24 family protein
MTLTEDDILVVLMKWRVRITAAAWVIVQDTQISEDIFQNVVLKAVTKNVTFEVDVAVLSWALISARREGIDLIRRHRREASLLDTEILDLLDRDWSFETVVGGGRTPKRSRHEVIASRIGGTGGGHY